MNHKRRVLAAFIAFVLIIAASPSFAVDSNAAIADGTVVYYEDFDYADTTGNAKVLSKLGWSLSEGLNSNIADYSITGGRLLCNTIGKSASNDSYVTILDNAQMKEIASGDYTISYRLTYAEAAAYTRYVNLIYNYNGYKSYNSFHARIAGYGNNQVRSAASWYNYDDSSSNYYAPASGTSSISYKLFGIKSVSADASSNTNYPLAGKELLIRIAVDIDAGPTVYINGQKISVPVSTYKELFLSAQQYASAVALKTTGKVKAYIDDVMIYTGLGDVPSNVRKQDVTYVMPEKESISRELKIMSLNTLYSNQADVAFSDGLNRSYHMYNLVSGVHPDILGMQERAAANKSGVTSLLSSNSGYAVADEYRTDTSVSGVVTQVPILYNTNRFSLVANASSNGNYAHGALLYAKSYNVKDMTASQIASYSGTKGLAWAVLKDKKYGGYILALNTHLAIALSSYTNYTADDARAARISNINETFGVMKKVYSYFGNIPTVFTGDFNMRESDPAYHLVLTKLVDSMYLAPDTVYYEYTMNNSSETIKNPAFLSAPNMPIDHIFISERDFTVNGYKVLNSCNEMRVASDHMGITVSLSINETASPVCSVSTGVYKSAQTVTLTGDGTIYYTTDMTDPRTSSTRKVYGGGIFVSNDTNIKYAAYKGGVYSNVRRVTLYFGTPVYITEASKNPPGRDAYEGFEIINVSSIPVDLSDFVLWYSSNTDETAVKTEGAGVFKTQLRLSHKEGENIVRPGDIVYLPIFTSEQYLNKRAVSSTEEAYLVTLSPDATEVTYHYDRIARAIAYDGSGNVTPDKIIILDRTARSIGYTESGTLVKRRDYYNATDGSVNNLSGSFALGNAVFNRLYLELYTEKDNSSPLCVFDLDSTGGGTVLNDGTPEAATGSYNYVPGTGSVMTVESFAKKLTIGTLTESQQTVYDSIIAKKASPDGTAVTTASQFAAMSPGGSYYLAADITISSVYTEKFTGSFNGNGHTITTTVPLFEDMSGIVCDLNVNGIINVNGGYNAAVSKQVTGTAIFDGINVNVSLSGGTTTGGVLGYGVSGSKISVSNCVNKGSISGSTQVGGIVGYVQGVTLTVSGCRNDGKITSSSYCAGIVGRFGKDASTVDYICKINGCVNNGEVSASGSRAAGILGYSVGMIELYGCTNNGSVHFDGAPVQFAAGGILGASAKTYTDSSGNTVNTVNGLIVKNCENFGEIYSTGHAGGIVGKTAMVAPKTSYTITASANHGTITVSDNGDTATTKGAAGIVGYFYGGNSGNGVFHCFNTGAVMTLKSGTSAAPQRACGLVAYVNSETVYIKDCYNSGSIGATGSYATAYQLFCNIKEAGASSAYISNNHALAVNGANYELNGSQSASYKTFGFEDLENGVLLRKLNAGAGETYYYQLIGTDMYPTFKEHEELLAADLALVSSSLCRDDGTYIKRVPSELTVESFALEFKNSVVFYDGENEVSGSAVVFTGMIVSSTDGKKTRKIAVTGDVDGDGTVTQNDYLVIKSFFRKNASLTGEYYVAADTDENGKITVSDYIKIKRFLERSIAF